MKKSQAGLNRAKLTKLVKACSLISNRLWGQLKV